MADMAASGIGVKIGIALGSEAGISQSASSCYMKDGLKFQIVSMNE